MEVVYHHTENQIHRGQECLRADHPLPEVHRVAHLRHEGREEHGTTIGKHGLHGPVDRGDEPGAAGGEARGRRAGERADRTRDAKVRAERGGQGGEVGRVVRDQAHDDEHAQQVYPDGEVGQPREPLHGADLADDHAREGKDEHAHDEAEPRAGAVDLRDLGDGLAVEEDEEGDDDEELDRLGDVDEVARPGAETPEEEVGVVADRVAVRVEAEEQLPQDPAGAVFPVRKTK